MEGVSLVTSPLDVCRSCLSSHQTLQIDETIIDTYNLLTRLSISLDDGLSQVICLECSITLNNYIIFRNNCIVSETSLRQLHEHQKININEINTDTTQSAALDVKKEEIKEESVLNAEYLDNDYLGDTDFDNVEETSVTQDNNHENLPVFAETESKGKLKRKLQSPEHEKGSTRTSKRKKNDTSKAYSNNKYPCGLCVNSFDNKQDLTKHVETHKVEYLVCGICEESFHSWPALVGHRLSHIKNRTQCHLCTVSMGIPLYMEGHFIKKHCNTSESIQLMCIPCNKPFRSAKRLQEHIKFSHSEKRHQCFECDKKFISNSKLQIHKRSHDRSNENKKKVSKKNRPPKTFNIYPCGLCTKKFDHKPDLTEHVETHKTGMLSCQLCDDVILTWPALVGHRLAHTKPDQTMPCHLCSIYKARPTYMELHYIKKHCDPSENKKLMCHPCNKPFETARKLQQHTAYCHSEKKIPCPFCEKKFITNSVLRSHMIKHDDAGRIFSCDKCEFQCKTLISLRSHKLKSHSEVSWKCNNCKYIFGDEARYKKHKCSSGKIVCTICGKMPKSMKSHLKTHQNTAKFKCDMCSKSYYSKNSLAIHIYKHSGVRKYMCEFCPMKFFTNALLIKHRRTHTGEKPFVCKVCNKGFTGGHNLKVHMRVHGEYLIKKKGEEENNEIFC